MHYEDDDPRLPMHGAPGFDRRDRGDRSTLLITLAIGVLAGVAGYASYQQATRNHVERRPGDSAPGRTARQRSFGRYAVTGRTVTINAPRADLYAYWRDFSNLPSFMENVHDVRVEGDVTHWTIRAPLGRKVVVRTRIVHEREGELIAWRSIEGSDIDTEGKVTFRDAPGGRGAQVEAIVAYVPPGGELGRWVAKAFQAEPAMQGRRELRRFKMLMEAGEIATNQSHKPEAA